MRALARDPARRYPSAAAFLSALRAVSSGEWLTAHAIAILDFDNHTQNPIHAWIATGIAEALAADLKKISGIEVVSGARVAKICVSNDGSVLKDSAATIGLRLGCRWVLAGGNEVVGEALRVTMHLTETATERAVATEKIDGSLSGLFEIQDPLATRISTR